MSTPLPPNPDSYLGNDVRAWARDLYRYLLSVTPRYYADDGFAQLPGGTSLMPDEAETLPFIAKITANNGSGSYTVTQQREKSDASGFEDHPQGKTAVSAIEAHGFAHVPANTFVLIKPHYDGNTQNVVFVFFYSNAEDTARRIGPTGATPSEHQQAAYADSWDSATDASSVEIFLQTGESYDHAGDEKLYAYWRKFTFANGNVARLQISAEQRIEVEDPTLCS